MIVTRSLSSRRFLARCAALLVIVGCGGSDDPGTGPGGGNNQTASAVATPASGTIARGATVNTTVVFTATGGLTIGSSFGLTRQFSGISITQTSSQVAGSTITKGYALSADASVPTGTHEVRFSTPVSGYTGSGSAPTAIAVFSLTVTP
ncbi:MAG: hypothetical protein IT353_15145 [Gemmatimonadaceae bacterium]|nr:hypothetical protein [Gemmatimonadaceae bacterium]